MLTLHWDALAIGFVVALLALYLIAQLVSRVNALQFLEALREAKREQKAEPNLGDRAHRAHDQSDTPSMKPWRHVS